MEIANLKLSQEQMQPLLRKTKNASILAAAGSGKTRTLVSMLMADLISGIPAKDIIAITFTEKAADELILRIHQEVKKHPSNIDLSGIYIGTIHGWCLQYLSNVSSFYNFSTLDQIHLESLISRFYDQLQLPQIYGKIYPFGIADFVSDLEIYYNENLSLEKVPDNLRDSIRTIQDVLLSNKMMTFGDMIRYSINDLKEKGPIENIKRLYVDEYQDVNSAQVELLHLIANHDTSTIIVGDDLQSIYNWRGSDVKRILNFPNEYSDVSVYRLSENYRSRPQIVDLANNIANDIPTRDSKKVMKAARIDTGIDSVNWLSLTSPNEQIDSVIDILFKHHEKGVPWNKMAILLRSVTGSGKPFVEALEMHGIPVNCPPLSRSTDFINEFIMPVIDWLRKDHIEPRNEVEEKQIEDEALFLWESVSKWILIENAEDTFWDSLNDWIDKLDENQNDTYDVRGRFYELLDSCGIGLKKDDNELLAALGIATQIIRSVEEIHRRRISGNHRRSPRGVLSEVYFALKRNLEKFGESLPINSSIDGVLISTVHQTKGLEWPVVIIPLLSSRKFPLPNKGHGTSFSDEVAGKYGTNLEDERRLFYVAATRARERLYFLDANKKENTKRSIFLKDLAKTGTINIKHSTSEILDANWYISQDDLEKDNLPPIRIGLSDLLIHQDCPFQFGIRRVVGIQPSVGDELGFGKGLHELIQRRLEAEEDWSLSEVKRQVDIHVHLPYMTLERENMSKQAIVDRVYFLQTLGALNKNIESEVKIELPVNKGIIYGIIDSLELTENNSLFIRDWKSNIHEDFISRYEKQLQFYNFVMKKEGKVIEGTDIVDVGETLKQKKLVAREVDVSDVVVDGLIANLNEAMDQVSSKNFQPTPKKTSCGACDFNKICLERWNN
ncbi:ATP-dependent DNA helicase [Planococcus sp. CAU13]|uniref:ATP-dependent DNA helicase n=1 Tax=Planococcus sp. CAU13 TaxID=1541197 RepID=UPI00052FF4DB|nr:ATP-dependent DNA helicase [Planococcus sp. CAU13]